MKPNDPAWNSLVQAPRIVADADAETWDDDVDVVVVGFGGAGATTALKSAEAGLSVVALDKAEGGGATEASGGVVYAGGGTRVQQEVGEEDTPENMYAYLKLETGGVVSDETLMRFCRESAANLDWLMNRGVRFSGPVWKEKTSYPNVDYFLYHSDNSLLPEYKKHATPAARGHRGVMRKGRSAVDLGGSIYLPLKARCLEMGVVLKVKTDVDRLVLDERGRVVGVEALQLMPDSSAFTEHRECLRKGNRLTTLYPFFLPGARSVHARARRYFERAREIEQTQRLRIRIRARRGVCLSAGGFIFNKAMVEHYCPAFAGGMPLGTPTDDGAGIRLGQSVGGSVAHMDRATAWRFINPPLAWSQGIIVDSRGRRFVNESCYGATIGDAMVNQADGRGWLLIDNGLVKSAWKQIWPTKVLPFQWQLGALNMLFGKQKYRDQAHLCEGLGFDPVVLEETLNDVAKCAEMGVQDRFGKPVGDLRKLELPLHAIDVSLAARLLPCTVLTMGGLRVNEATGEVVGQENVPVAGLYAAGRSAVGLPSHLYMSGLSIADCVFSGLRAAGHMANQEPGV